MNVTDFDEFYGLMELLKRYYRLTEFSADEVAAYFDQLKPFALEIVSEAVDRAPSVHPSFFPKAGELLALCELVAVDFRKTAERRMQRDRDEFQRIAACQHDYEIQPEPAGGLFESFRVCRKCEHAIPVISKAAEVARQSAYLQRALGAQ